MQFLDEQMSALHGIRFVIGEETRETRYDWMRTALLRERQRRTGHPANETYYESERLAAEYRHEWEAPKRIAAAGFTIESYEAHAKAQRRKDRFSSRLCVSYVSEGTAVK
jgi:hypothetical protein